MSVICLQASGKQLYRPMQESLLSDKKRATEIIIFNTGLVFVRDASQPAAAVNEYAQRLACGMVGLCGDVELYCCDEDALHTLITEQKSCAPQLVSIGTRALKEYEAYLELVRDLGDKVGALGVRFWWNDWEAMGKGKTYAIVLPKMSDYKVVYQHAHAHVNTDDLTAAKQPSKGGNFVDVVAEMQANKS